MKKLVLLLILGSSIILTQYLSTVSAEEKRSVGRSPMVKIISPREGEIVRGKIQIQAQVSEPSAVRYVRFFFQEPGAKDRYGWNDYSNPYIWGGDEQKLDTTLFNDGRASASVVCHPKDRRLPKTKDRVHFTIDNGKPKVRILSPKNEASIRGDVLVRVDASDAKGMKKEAGIAGVSIYLDGSLLHSLVQKPFQARFSAFLLAPGRHSIRAVVEDSEGLISSDVVMINLSPEASSLVVEE